MGRGFRLRGLVRISSAAPVLIRVRVVEGGRREDWLLRELTSSTSRRLCR
jgi:hypothetical protein